MPNRPLFQPVALAGAVAISASLIGFAALHTTAGPTTQTRAVMLTAGDAEVFLPDLSTFTPTVAEGFPPLEEVLQGAETWSLANSPGVIVNLDGNDTQTTIGSFVNNDFLERGGVEGGAGAGVPLPASGSEIDLMSFGGGYESEWANLIDANGGHTITDTLITPFGNYTIPLGTTVAEVAAATPAASLSFADLLSSVEGNISAGENLLGVAETAFTNGDYSVGLADALAGFDNLTVGAGSEFLLNGYAFLTGDGGNAALILDTVARPSDLSAGLTEAQGFLDQAQPFFGAFITDLAAGHGYAGLADLTGIGIDSSYATDAIVLGLFDSIPGVTVFY